MEKPGSTWRKCLTVLAIVLAVSFTARTKTDAATDNEKTAYAFFMDNMNLSPAAACGIMANIREESRFRSDIAGLGGAYGLCQWTGIRLSRLRSWCRNNGYTYTTCTGQLQYLKYELQTYFPQVNNYMKTVANTSKGAYNAGFYWCYYYERPANTYATACRRGSMAQSSYWNDMGSESIYLTAAVASNGVKLSWNKACEEGCRILRAAKLNGTYKLVATLEKSTRKYVDRSAKIGKKYYYYIEPLTAKGEAGSRSNKVYCNMQCSLQDNECRIKLSKTSYTYDGKEKKPKVTVYYDGTRLKKNRDYTVSYSSNTNAGTAYVRVSGMGDYAGTKKFSFEIGKARQRLKVSAVNTVLQEEPILLKISVKENAKLKFSTNDTQVATARSGKLFLKGAGVTTLTVKAAATKNYGEAVKSVKITVLPSKPVIKKAASETKGSALIKWKKEKNVSGYQLQYERGSSFHKNSGLLRIEGEDKNQAAVEDLTPGKNYIFRVRSFVMIDGQELFSEWSSPVKLKIIK